MAECRACLVKKVRMHIVTNTRYRELFEKLTGNKLRIEDGRPETICYICNAQLQRFWRFFEMSQKTEKMLTTRLLFGIEMQGTLDITNRLSTTAVTAVSFVDGGAETDAAPEVTVTVKEELDDVDEWERFKEEFMDSPSDEFDNDYEPIKIPQTEKTQRTEQHKEITEITNILENAEQRERELKNELLDFIKTESIETEETLNEQNSNLQNISTEEFPMKTEDIINLNPIKEEKFPVKANMRYHMPKPKLNTYYYCDKCEYRCQQSKTLRKHSKHHDLKNQFACTFCLYRFPDESKLARHRKYCTVCSICGKKFHNLNGLRIHIRLHTGEQPFSCDLCGRGFNQKTNLQTHLRVHAREKQYPCEICHKIFPFTSYLKRHMLIHSENYIDGESMHRIQNCHKLFSRKKKAMSSCTVCGKILRKDSMAMHMRLHTGEQPFSCEKCLRYFNQKCNLLTHVERCHPGDPLFACKVCFKTFAMNSELRKHLVTHGVKVEIKKELIAQTEQTIKKFISRYEKEVERMEALTEADKKMELILNLGLKPRVVNPQEPNGMIVIPNFNEGRHNEKATKRKSSILDTGIQKAKRKATGISVLRDSMDGIIKGIKIEGFLPYNTKVDIEESNSAANKIIKQESNLEQENVDKENDLASPENVTCTDKSQVLQIFDPKAQEPSNDSTENTEKINSLTTDDIPELNCIFVATNRSINKSSNEEGTQNIKEVEIKRELISENEDLPENKVLIESVDNIKPTEDINQTNEASNENVIAEELSIKNELRDFEYCNEIHGDDIEYFDDSIEIVEVEISDSESCTNLTEENAENEEIAFTNEDLEVTDINLNQNSLAGTEEEKTISKEVLATEELKDSSQVLLSDNDVKNEDARRQSISYTGVEVSVIDPDDLDDSVIYSEEEYLDLTDDELIGIDDDKFDEDEEPSDAILDLSDAENKRHITKFTNTPQLKSCNEPRIKLRNDLFAYHNDDKFKLNLNVETNNRISAVNSENMSTKEANIDFIVNNGDLEVIATKEHLEVVATEENLEVIATEENLEVIVTEEHLEDIATEEHLDEFTDTEYLETDSNYDHVESIATIEDNFDDITYAEDLSSDSNNATLISVKDFDLFQQKHQISVHRRMSHLATPYPCDLCVTKVFSY